MSTNEIKHRVAVIGSGNWGSAIARIVAQNTVAHPRVFDRIVRMWVHEELVGQEKLSWIINQTHENIKYLPGIKLPENIIAEPEIGNAVRDATILIFNMPHQFIERICHSMKAFVNPQARGISCIKGVKVSAESCIFFPDVISGILGIPCGALSGANIASEVASDKFSEVTIAYDEKAGGGQLCSEDMRKLFHRESFHVQMCTDVAGVCLGGALKNIVAVAAGFIDGLGWGDNAKAAIMRRGLVEMRKFGEMFFAGQFEGETIMSQSCGVADLITSCAGGRNRKCAEAFVRTGKSMAELEEEMLNGQKLQGTDTCKDVYAFLQKQGKQDEFPLFCVVYRIVYEGVSASRIVCGN